MAQKKTKRQADKGLIEIQPTIGFDINGKRIRKSFYGKTKREAKEKFEKYKADKQAGELLTKNITFGAWANTWLETYKRPKRADATKKMKTYKDTYLSTVKNHLIPYFGRAQINNIRPVDIINFYNTIKDKSQSLNDKCKICLNAIFETAIDNDLCIKNPARRSGKPKGKQTKEQETYSQKQVDAILEYAKNHRFGFGIFLMLKLATSRSETLGLMQKDIVSGQNVIKVDRAVTYVPGEGAIIGDVKRPSRRRFIPYDDETAAEIKRRGDTPYLLMTKNKTPYSPDTWTRRCYNVFFKDFQATNPHITVATFNTVINEYTQLRGKLTFDEDKQQMAQKRYVSNHPKIPTLSSHKLRHTCGTLLRKRGVPVDIIQQFMGHADINITANTYLHYDVTLLQKHLDF